MRRPIVMAYAEGNAKHVVAATLGASQSMTGTWLPRVAGLWKCQARRSLIEEQWGAY